MEEIVKVSKIAFAEEEVSGVDARELWKFLEVETRFNDWISKRVSEYDFCESKDFYSFLSKTINGGRPSKEYSITIDMAKELSMVERNEKGKEARKYFIECEKRLKQKDITHVPQTFAEALQLAADQAKQIEDQKTILIEQAPKVEFVEKFVDATGLYTLTVAAKKLKVKRKDLIAILERDKFLFRRGKKLEAYACKVGKGFFEIKAGEAGGHAYSQTYLTARGLEMITENYMTELGE
jgi:anti-repressor protein